MNLLQPFSSTTKSTPRSELSAALASCRSAFIATALFSGMSNILMLTGAIFMLEIYDRVLPSHSVPTLVALIVLATSLYAALGILDLIRSRILVRVGASLDEAISDRVYDALVCLPLKAGNRGDGLQSLRNLDSLRSFLSGMGPIALFDIPWIPLYLIICFAFHTLIGLTALFGAIVLCALTILTEVYTRDSTKQVVGLGVSRNNLADMSRRNAEALVAMGMTRRLAYRWRQANRKYIASQQQTSDIAGGFASTSKVLRMVLQSAVLAVGAYLVINQQATAGIIIAGSILSARALAPVDLAIANWTGFVAARQSWRALNQLLTIFPVSEEPMSLSLLARASSSKPRAWRHPAASAWSLAISILFCRLAAVWESSVRAALVNRASQGCSLLSGNPRVAKFAWMERLTINGRPKLLGNILATFRKTSSFCRAPSRKILLGSRQTRSLKRSSPLRRPPAFMILLSACPRATELQ